MVTAGAIEVRALGTEFAVEVRAQGVDVLVTEGRVAVERLAPLSSPVPAVVLDAGQTVAVERGAAAPPGSIRVTEEERKARLA